MTEDNRIPCPSFDVALFALLDVVAESPEQSAQRAYLDSAGFPHDLVAHVLNRLDAPINTAAQGHLRHHVIAQADAGVPGTARNVARLPLIWNRLFLWGDGEGTPYDAPNVLFPEMIRLRRPAEEYLVYALLNHVQRANDRKSATWGSAARRGLATFRTFLLSPSSGFLVQTRGSHEDLLQYVDQLTLVAYADLSK